RLVGLGLVGLRRLVGLVGVRRLGLVVGLVIGLVLLGGGGYGRITVGAGRRRRERSGAAGHRLGDADLDAAPVGGHNGHGARRRRDLRHALPVGLGGLGRLGLLGGGM